MLNQNKTVKFQRHDAALQYAVRALKFLLLVLAKTLKLTYRVACISLKILWIACCFLGRASIICLELSLILLAGEKKKYRADEALSESGLNASDFVDDAEYAKYRMIRNL